MTKETAEPNSGAEQSAVTGPSPSWAASLAGRLWPILGLFLLGLIAGFLAQGLLSEHPQKVVARQSMEPPRPVPAAIRHRAKADLAIADQLLKQGRPESALDLYQQMQPVAGRAPDAIAYRIALCLELTHQYNRALDQYQRLADRCADLRCFAACQIAMARLWLRLDKPAKAKQLLCAAILHSGRAERSYPSLLADAEHLLACSLAMEVLSTHDGYLLDPAAVAAPKLSWPADHALEWAEHDSPGTDGDSLSSEAQTINVEGAELGPEQALTRVNVTRMPLETLLGTIAESVSLRTEWTSAARRAAATHRVTVSVTALPLRHLLTALTAPGGLEWQIDGPTLRVAATSDMTTAELAALAANRAELTTKAVLLAWPDHPLGPTNYLALGNLQFATKRWSEAIGTYEQHLRMFPRSPQRPTVYFNLAKSLQRTGQVEQACEWLYRVVDLSPNDPLAGPAFILIGDSLLETGQARKAVSPLRRAVATADGTEYLPIAAVNLATAYLLSQNPGAASQVLRQHKERLSGKSTRHYAAFLDALARFQVLRPTRTTAKQKASLLSALLAVKPQDVPHTAGLVLMAQAYRQLGLGQDMLKLCRQALDRAPHQALANQLRFAMADYLYSIGSFDQAKALLTELAGEPSSSYSRRAWLRLARMAFDQGRCRQCLQMAHALLAQAPGPEPELVRLMGQAYEKLGDYKHAALCFAGQVATLNAAAPPVNTRSPNLSLRTSNLSSYFSRYKSDAALTTASEDQDTALTPDTLSPEALGRQRIDGTSTSRIMQR